MVVGTPEKRRKASLERFEEALEKATREDGSPDPLLENHATAVFLVDERYEDAENGLKGPDWASRELQINALKAEMNSASIIRKLWKLEKSTELQHRQTQTKINQILLLAAVCAFCSLALFLRFTF